MKDSPERSSLDLLNHRTIAERYFFPRSAALAGPVHRIQSGDVELACSLDPGDPLIVHFHGNGEVVADWVPEIPAKLAAGGVGSLFAEYRGYGQSSGTPALASMLDDALAAVDAAGVEPARIVAYGRSVGSLFALHVAAHRPIAGLIIESGIADVRERLLLRMRPGELGATAAELDAALAEHFDHQAKLRAYGGPLLVFHAAGDDLVPPRHGEQLAAWAGERATLRLFERGDHNTIFAFNGDAIIDETIAFAKRVTA